MKVSKELCKRAAVILTARFVWSNSLAGVQYWNQVYSLLSSAGNHGFDPASKGYWGNVLEELKRESKTKNWIGGKL